MILVRGEASSRFITPRPPPEFKLPPQRSPRWTQSSLNGECHYKLHLYLFLSKSLLRPSPLCRFLIFCLPLRPACARPEASSRKSDKGLSPCNPLDKTHSSQSFLSRLQTTSFCQLTYRSYISVRLLYPRPYDSLPLLLLPWISRFRYATIGHLHQHSLDQKTLHWTRLKL